MKTFKQLREKAPNTSDAMKRYKAGKAGFTDIAHLKAKGLIKRSDGTKKKSDKFITYQLTLYKKFFCQKHNIDPKLVETHFALLKRTAKKDNVEIFRVTSGPRKVNNATKLLKNALIHISRGNHVKDRRSCSRCEFRKTIHCK